MTDKDKNEYEQPLTEGKVKKDKKPKAPTKKPTANHPAPKPKKAPKAKQTGEKSAEEKVARKKAPQKPAAAPEKPVMVDTPVGEAQEVNVFAVPEADKRTRFQRVVDWLIAAFS